jgi:hypothetical protein
MSPFGTAQISSYPFIFEMKEAYMNFHPLFIIFIPIPIHCSDREEKFLSVSRKFQDGKGPSPSRQLEGIILFCGHICNTLETFYAFRQFPRIPNCVNPFAFLDFQPFSFLSRLSASVAEQDD